MEKKRIGGRWEKNKIERGNLGWDKANLKLVFFITSLILRQNWFKQKIVFKYFS